MLYVMCGSKSVDSDKYVEAVTLDLLDAQSCIQAGSHAASTGWLEFRAAHFGLCVACCMQEYLIHGTMHS